jgi:hypothetical protein
MDTIDKDIDKRLQALREIEIDKTRMAKAYNKWIKLKSFHVGDLVWKMIFPVVAKHHKFWQIVAIQDCEGNH